MTRNDLLKSLPSNTIRTDIHVTAKTLWLVPVGGQTTELAVVRVIGDEPLDIAGYAKTLTYRGRVENIIASMHKIGSKTFVTQLNTDLRFVLPPSNTHMEIAVEP